MTRVREPPVEAAALTLLTLRHHGFGPAPIDKESLGNAFTTAGAMWQRVFGCFETYAQGLRYATSSLRTAVNCRALAVHLDGKTATEGPNPKAASTCEVTTVRYANCLRGLTREEQRAELAALRASQPLTSMSLWLSLNVALDVEPCSGVGLVPGMCVVHTVPAPPPDPAGRDMERGGTRSLAMSQRPDNVADNLEEAVAQRAARGHGPTGGGFDEEEVDSDREEREDVGGFDDEEDSGWEAGEHGGGGDGVAGGGAGGGRALLPADVHGAAARLVEPAGGRRTREERLAVSLYVPGEAMSDPPPAAARAAAAPAAAGAPTAAETGRQAAGVRRPRNGQVGGHGLRRQPAQAQSYVPGAVGAGTHPPRQGNRVRTRNCPGGAVGTTY